MKRRRSPRQRIVQIIPGGGWHAVYAQRPSKEGEGWTFTNEVVCWALVEDETGWQSVVGMEVNTYGYTVSFCQENTNWIGYVSPDDVPHVEDIYRSFAADHLEHFPHGVNVSREDEDDEGEE